MKLLAPMCAVAAALLAHGALAAQAAQDYPRRSIRLVMPIGTGSANDTLGRIVANKMSQLLGQNIVVDNRAGAGGIVGMEVGANATPDGYTLIAGSAAAMTIVPNLHKKIPYDPVDGYEHIGQYVVTPNVLVTSTAVPARTVRELIDYARSRNGNLNMASSGVGSQSHLTGVMFMTAAKMTSVHVPYKGGAATLALLTNEAQWRLPPAPSVMTLVRSGQLRALAHTMPQRSLLLGDIPPIAETLPGFSYSGWNGLIAPKKTPAAILHKVHETMARAVASPEVRKDLDQQVAQVDVTDGRTMRAFVASQIRENGKLVQAAGLKPE